MDPGSSFGKGFDDEAGVAGRLWAKFKKYAVFSQYDPFVVALAAGTLKRASFLNYIEQDAYFLEKYAEACKMAEDCADNDDDKKTINRLGKAIEEELNLHNASIAKQRKDAEVWDDSAKGCFTNMATVQYTKFLLATAAGQVEGGEKPKGSVNPVEKQKILAYTIGAMIPCSRLYTFLGQEIVKALDNDISDHSYKQWIGKYSSENSEASTLQTEKLLDKLANSLTGEDLEVLERLYCHALILERDFFSAQPFYQRILVPLLKLSDSANHRYTIVSDFELSCTVLDSPAVLSEMAILTTLKAEQNCAENFNDCKSSLNLRNTWDAFSIQCPEEYEEYLGKILPPEQGYLLSTCICNEASGFMHNSNTISKVFQNLDSCMTTIPSAQEITSISTPCSSSYLSVLLLVSCYFSVCILSQLFKVDNNVDNNVLYFQLICIGCIWEYLLFHP